MNCVFYFSQVFPERNLLFYYRKRDHSFNLKLKLSHSWSLSDMKVVANCFHRFLVRQALSGGRSQSRSKREASAKRPIASARSKSQTNDGCFASEFIARVLTVMDRWWAPDRWYTFFIMIIVFYRLRLEYSNFSADFRLKFSYDCSYQITGRIISV